MAESRLHIQAKGSIASTRVGTESEDNMNNVIITFITISEHNSLKDKCGVASYTTANRTKVHCMQVNGSIAFIAIPEPHRSQWGQ